MTEESQPVPAAQGYSDTAMGGHLEDGNGTHWASRRHRPPTAWPGQFPDPVPMAPRELGSVGWALAPLITAGMAAGPCFAYAAVRLRSRALGLAAAGYAAVSALIVWGDSWNSNSTFEIDLGVVAVLTLWGMSTAHALAIRRALFFGDAHEDDAVVAAKDRIRRREESRRIAVTDPRLARELRIGRPDQPSAYDDGGLVDVNHVPVECLSGMGVIGSELAHRIVEARDLVRGFDNRDDLEAVIGLDPRSLDEVSDLLIFCR
jgi:DNA uptake protein ComE-like DNA-binding protein